LEYEGAQIDIKKSQTIAKAFNEEEKKQIENSLTKILFLNQEEPTVSPFVLLKKSEGSYSVISDY
jgi:hypothetical protein